MFRVSVMYILNDNKYHEGNFEVTIELTKFGGYLLSKGGEIKYQFYNCHLNIPVLR